MDISVPKIQQVGIKKLSWFSCAILVPRTSFDLTSQEPLKAINFILSKEIERFSNFCQHRKRILYTISVKYRDE